MRAKRPVSRLLTPPCRGLLGAAFLLVSARLLAGPSGTSMFRPVSSPADSIHRYSLFVLGITGAIFAVVFTMLVVALVRFRRRPGDDASEPPPGLRQRAGRGRVDRGSDIDRDRAGADDGADRVRSAEPGPAPGGTRGHGDRPPVVVGVSLSGVRDRDRQRAPPRSRQRPRTSVADLPPPRVGRCGPQLLGAAPGGEDGSDPRPGQRAVVDPRETGLFEGQCAEYCGTQHAKMLLRVYVHSREDFDRWVAAQRASSAALPEAEEGRRVFETTGLPELPHGPRHDRATACTGRT